MDRLITDYKCTDCSAVFDRPGPCPKCPYGYRRPVVPQLAPELDSIVIETVPPHDFMGPDDIMGPHGPGCMCQ
jgi:hypothetical protein